MLIDNGSHNKQGLSQTYVYKWFRIKMILLKIFLTLINDVIGCMSYQRNEFNQWKSMFIKAV